LSWRDAPLYVEAHDLARWIVQRAHGWSCGDDQHLASLVVGNACEILTSVSLALTFPATRARHLETADHGIVRLRVLLRLARDVELLSAGGLRFASGRLRVMGKMIGGWRKRLNVSRPVPGAERPSHEFQGMGSQRREPRDPWGQFQERRAEGACCEPEQERPGDRERESGLPCGAPRRPEPAATNSEPWPRAGPSPAADDRPPARARPFR